MTQSSNEQTLKKWSDMLDKVGLSVPKADWLPIKGPNWNTITRCSKISNIFGIEYEPKKTFKVPVGNLSPSKAKKEISNLIRQYTIPIGRI